MASSKSQTKLSRRAFVGGGMALGAGLSVLSASSASAALLGTQGASSGLKAGIAGEATSFHCSLIHPALSNHLGKIANDPTMSAEQISKAMRTTRCFCCDTQISAAHPFERNHKADPVYVFSSDARAKQPGYLTIPG